MQNIKSATDLREAIELLESKQRYQEKMLREQFRLTSESFRPVNIIKNTMHELAASQELKGELLNTAIGLGAGYISKRIFEGVSHNPLRKLLGTALMFGITNTVAKDPEAVKSFARNLFRVVRSRLAGRTGGAPDYTNEVSV